MEGCTCSAVGFLTGPEPPDTARAPPGSRSHWPPVPPPPVGLRRRTHCHSHKLSMPCSRACNVLGLGPRLEARTSTRWPGTGAAGTRGSGAPKRGGDEQTRQRPGSHNGSELMYTARALAQALAALITARVPGTVPALYGARPVEQPEKCPTENRTGSSYWPARSVLDQNELPASCCASHCTGGRAAGPLLMAAQLTIRVN